MIRAISPPTNSEPFLQPPSTPDEGRKPLRERLGELGLFGEGQMAARRWPIGCVSLEITQRCNLDCALCYLSEHSEAVRDIPLEEVFRRIDMIDARYGPGIDVQVSGGETRRFFSSTANLSVDPWERIVHVVVMAARTLSIS